MKYQLLSPPLITVNRDEVLTAKETMRSDVLVNVPTSMATRLNMKVAVAVEDLPRHPDAKKVWGRTAIPAGTYPLEFRFSPKLSGWFYTHDDIRLITKKEWEAKPKWERDAYHQHELIYIREIPGFDLVMIHWGNTSLDTDACLVVGANRGMLGTTPGVLNSRDTYVKLYAQVAGAIRQAIAANQRYTIQYIDAFPPSKLVGAPSVA
jgi:hypothetical protein